MSPSLDTGQLQSSRRTWSVTAPAIFLTCTHGWGVSNSLQWKLGCLANLIQAGIRNSFFKVGSQHHIQELRQPVPSTPSLVYTILCLRLPLGETLPRPSVNKHSYYKALAQISKPDFLFWMVAKWKCALSSGIKPCHSRGCCAMCGRELPLGMLPGLQHPHSSQLPQGAQERIC